MPSKKEIETELKRRGISIPRSDDEILSQQLQQPQQQQQMDPNLEQSWVEKIGSGTMPYVSKPLDAFGGFMEKFAAPVAGGILQGVGSSAASIGNLGLSPFTDKRIPHPDLKQYLQPGDATDIGFLVGEMGGYGLGGGAAGKALGAGSKAAGFGQQGGLVGLLSDLAVGSGAGAAISEDLPGGRALGAALGGGVNLLPAVMPGSVGKLVLKGKEAAQKLYGKKYDKVFDLAKELNVFNNVRVPNVKQVVIKRAPGGSKFVESIKRFENNPTLKNAHEAQSDMGKLARKLQSLDRKRGLISTERKALEEALNAQKKYRGEMFRKMQEAKNSNLTQSYADVTKGYAQDVAPYLNSKTIQSAAAGELPAWRIPYALGNPLTKEGHMFRQALGQQYPQIPLTMAATGAGGASALGVGGLLYNLFKGE